MFDCLASFRAIGWDFDETLIDSPRSREFWRFIELNPFDQEHHIVTFRSAGLEKRIFDDLRIRGSRLTAVHFDGVHSIPHELWQDYHMQPVGGVIQVVTNDPYMVWKGMTCASLGVEVLIDDMTHNVIQGCRKHGVALFHPDDIY